MAGRQLGRVPAFDGLRAVAVLSVLGFHMSQLHLLPGGWLGVNLFFVLSGFLITVLLLEERARTGTVSLRAFYARRAIRVFPALYAFIGVWALLLLFLHGHAWFAAVPNFPVNGGTTTVAVGLHGAWTALAQMTNWVSALGGQTGPTGQVWSVAVEWQFYLAWALLVLLALRKGRRTNADEQGQRRLGWLLPTLTVTLVAASALESPYLFATAGWNRVYFGTDTNLAALLLGALAGQAYVTGWTRRFIAGRWGSLLAFAAMVGLVEVAVTLHNSEPARADWVDTVVDVACTVVVAYLAERRDGFAARLLGSRPARYLGSRSYAFYLWSYAVATWTHPLGGWALPITLVGSLLPAELSWRGVERPAARLRHAGWIERLGQPEPAALSSAGTPAAAQPLPRPVGSRPRSGAGSVAPVPGRAFKAAGARQPRAPGTIPSRTWPRGSSRSDRPARSRPE